METKNYRLNRNVNHSEIRAIKLKATSFLICGFLLYEFLAYPKTYNKTVDENQSLYAEEIDDYNDNLESYANDIKNLNLNDLQTIMKVMDDTWKEIDGYGVADNLITGYYRLSFQEENKGVCTSFADDFTAKMNAIDPKYNARNLIVTLDEDSEDIIKIVDINRTIIDNDENKQGELQRIISNNIVGNHMVSIIDIPEEEISLMVDSTNLCIGIYRNGKIYCFNSESDDFIVYKGFGNYLFGGKELPEYFKEYFDSYYTCDESLQELDKKYGIDAQKEALYYVRNLIEKPKVLEKYTLNNDYLN